jgi:hypothetical protein
MKNFIFIYSFLFLLACMNISCFWFSLLSKKARLIKEHKKSSNKNNSNLKSSSNPNTINVHIIPHTHDDAGWLYSLEQYYTGDNNSGKCVKCILDNMLTSLESNKDRTFTYVEMAFFEKWYTQQSQDTKSKIKQLVKDGRLDFANAGWVMNDEAAAHYQHIIDQMRLGMHFLKKELDYTPKIAWYIDPFGHSLTNAYVLNKLGFDKLVMVRIDFREKEKLIKEKAMEFHWRPYYQLDQGESSILTHITHGHYSPDSDRFPDMLEKTYDSPSYFENQLDRIYNYFKDMSDSYPTKELMFLYGDDFTFKNANQNYLNIEAMIKAFSNNANYKDKINFFYSTPTKYFKAVEDKLKSEKISLKNYDGFDFFPYSEFKMDYWTGYFTSRPYLKGLIRDAGNYLEQTDSLIFNHLKNKDSFGYKNILDKIYALRRELGIAQHHDAVSGTARELVSKDYINRINSGIKHATDSAKEIIESDLKKLVNLGTFDSICIDAASQNECINKIYDKSALSHGIAVIYINPGLNSKLPVIIKVKVDRGVIVIDSIKNYLVNNDLICDSDLNYCEVNFFVEFKNDELYKIFKIQSSDESSEVTPYMFTKVSSLINLVDDQNSFLTFDTEKLLFSQKIKSTGEEYTFTISHGYYEYHSWKDPMHKNRQGAYLMATDEETPKKYTFDKNKSKYFLGKIITEVDLHFEQSKLKIRIYPGIDNILDVESVIFPYHPKDGLEFLLIINSDVNNVNQNNKTEFFTDTNGMRIIKRVKDTRQTFDFEVDDKVASNFYPINSVLSLKDDSKNKQISVWNDRSQAGTSLSKGEIFFVINRWSQRDDRKGLSDGIDEFDSSSINFHLNHWISLTQKNYDHEFLYNHINKKPMYAVYNTLNSNTPVMKVVLNNETSKLFLKNLEDKQNFAEEIFVIEDKECLEYNYYFIDEKQVLIQFLNRRDPYFYNSNSISSTSCKVQFKEVPEKVKNITRISLNGIDLKMSGKEIAFNVMSKIHQSPQGQTFLKPERTIKEEFLIKPLDFETFLVTLQ